MKTRRKRRGLKVFLTIVVILAILIAVLVAGAFALKKHDFGDRTEILKSASATPEKALVVYQPSLTPASHDVAYAIAVGLNDSGYEVIVSNPGKHLPADISGYSIVVFGSPNYGGSVADTLLDYIKKIGDFAGKRVVLYSTSGAVEIMPELEKLSELLNGTEPYKMVKYQFSETEKNKAAAYQLGVDTAG